MGSTFFNKSYVVRVATRKEYGLCRGEVNSSFRQSGKIVEAD